MRSPMIDERPVEADDDLARRRADDGVGHAAVSCRRRRRSRPPTTPLEDQLVGGSAASSALGLGRRPRPRGRRRRAAGSRRHSLEVGVGADAARPASPRGRWRPGSADGARPCSSVAPVLGRSTWAGMSRHQMTVSVGHVRRLRRRALGCDVAEVAEAGRGGARRRGPRRVGCGLRARAVELRVVGLGEVDEPPVVAEVHRQQLRVPVEPEARPRRARRSGGPGSRSGRTCRAPPPAARRTAAAPAIELVAVRARRAARRPRARARRRARRRCRSRRRRRRCGRSRRSRRARSFAPRRRRGSAPGGCGASPAGSVDVDVRAAGRVTARAARARARRRRRSSDVGAVASATSARSSGRRLGAGAACDRASALAVSAATAASRQ